MTTRRRLPLALAVLVAVGLLAAVASAAPGDPDTTFGTNGEKVVGLGGEDSGSAVALQPDGKIVVAGSSTTAGASDTDFAVLRLNADGSLDTTFGTNGGKVVGLGGNDFGSAVALQPDGKIVVAGSSRPTGASDTDFAVLRLNADGSLDTTFGTNGGKVVGLGGEDFGEAVALQPDGKIVVAGSSRPTGASDDDFAALRLNADGSLDTNFGTNGGKVVGLGGEDGGAGVALQPGGKIVIAGFSRPAGASDTDFAALRLNADGSLDTNFGTNGGKVVGLGGNDSGSGVALQPDGKIVVAGSSKPTGASDTDFAVLRLNGDGSLDTNFGTNGGQVVGLGGNDFGSAVALQPDGKIVVAGSSRPIGASDADFAALRLNGDGSLDTTFGTNGGKVVGLGGDDLGSAVALQSDGNIVVAGSSKPTGASDTDFAVARLLGDPAGGGGGPSGGLATTTLSTKATAKVRLGKPIADEAALGGGSSPGGSITFKAFNPGDENCAQSPAFTSPAVKVSGNGSYSSGDFKPARSGTYRWTASYSGDAKNKPSLEACNSPDETSRVKHRKHHHHHHHHHHHG